MGLGKSAESGKYGKSDTTVTRMVSPYKLEKTLLLLNNICVWWDGGPQAS